jgi:hypothetical protein
LEKAKMGVTAEITKSKNAGDLSRLLEVLDEKSQAMLWHLWCHRHAEVLHRLKRVINKQAERLWGKPIVGFEESRIDPLSGEKVLFSWWFLDEEDAFMADSTKALMDIFNEKDAVIVIARLPYPVEPSHSDIQFKNGILKIRLKKKEPK